MARLIYHERIDPLKEYGVVLKLDNGKAIIGIKRSSACSQCGACELGAANSQMRLTLDNTLNAQPGDIVELELPASQFLKASVILYLIPLVGLILGVVIGYYIGIYAKLHEELIGAIGGILFTIIAYMTIKKMEPKFRKNDNLNPKMIGIYTGEKGEYYNGK